VLAANVASQQTSLSANNREASLTFARLHCGTERVCEQRKDKFMDLPPATVDLTIKVYLGQIRERLDEAAGIARAVETCAQSGQVAKGIEIALDVERLVYEANTFLNAAS
jgi:hypothetical protein